MAERRAKKNYIFQMDKEKDKDIIDFMDNVKEEMNLTTFFRVVIREYMKESDRVVTIDLNFKDKKQYNGYIN